MGLAVFGRGPPCILEAIFLRNALAVALAGEITGRVSFLRVSSPSTGMSKH